MQKITIEIDEEMFNNLHNAVASYLDVLSRCMIGCEVPSKFESFENLSAEEIQEKRNQILNLYNQISDKMHD